MNSPQPQVRPAAVAGRFYAGEPAALGADIDAMLAAAPAASGPRPKALIVPHAGYMYSGPIAASAYKLLMNGPRPRRIVLLGPAHTVGFRGLALPNAGALATPLGQVRVDADAAARAAALPQVLQSAEAHAREHSLEVQLPFLQRVLGDDFTLVPLVVGHASAAQVAGVLDELWGDDDTLIVISTDLSHYHSYSDAKALDAGTAAQILELDGDIEPEQACGAYAVRGFLQAARARGLKPRLLDLRSSGDTAGDRRRVVGYASFAFAAEAA
jgi:AmmeMemoRadiSam system protein B